MLDLFKSIILVQLFYAVCITILTYAMPAASLNYVSSFSDITDTISLEQVGSEVQDSLDKQINAPVIELGALVFYSGNILLDLILNFAFAIPQMLGMIINGMMMLMSIDSFLYAQVQLFASVVVTVMYFVGLMQLLTNIRSQGKVT